MKFPLLGLQFIFAFVFLTSAALDAVEPSAKSPALTTEIAKAALLTKIRSPEWPDKRLFTKETLDRLSTITVREDEEGWCHWHGSLRFHLDQRRYEFSPMTGNRIYLYSGNFDLADGQWRCGQPS